MKHLQTVADVRAAVAGFRAAGETVALVPTMGNLHAGHMSLVSEAASLANRVIVSVFVNPTQFGPNEDFATYPRTLEEDSEQLAAAGVDLLFAPGVGEMYPHGLEGATLVSVPDLADDLCGRFRPGHFVGVTSVVCRLFNICAPDTAVFGLKDYQQFIILRRMVSDLHLPVKLVGLPIRRESDGLAMSSRNANLNDAERTTAPAIHAALAAAAERLRSGERDYAAIERHTADAIAVAGMQPEYVAVRSAADLSVPDGAQDNLVVLAAARLGAVRLIDNILLGEAPQ